MRFGRVGLVAVLVIALLALPAATASASERAPRSDGAPVAHAACPWCLVAAGVVVRGALLVRTAATVRTVVQVSRFARPAFRRAVSRKRLRRAVKASKKISRRSRRWVRRNWNKLPKSSRACAKGAGLLSAEQIIDGGFVTEKEFDAYLLFHYPMMPPTDKAEFKDAIDWREPLQTAAAGCVVGWLASDRS
jgi:hypothetical protein